MGKEKKKEKHRKSLTSRIFRGIGIALLSVVGLFVVLTVALFIVLTPSRLAKIVNNVASGYLEADVRFDKVSLALFEEFPYASLRIIDGKVISHAFSNAPDSLRSLVPARADSLLNFDEVLVSVSLPELMKGKFDIRRVRVAGPEAYVYVSPWGKANWEIFEQDTTDTGVTLDLNIGRIVVRDVKGVTYDSRADSMLLRAVIGGIHIKGNITLNEDEFEISRASVRRMEASVDFESQNMRAALSLDSLRIRNEDGRYGVILSSRATLAADTVEYFNELPLALEGGVSMNIGAGEYNLHEMKLSIAGIKALADGGVKIKQDSIFSDMGLRVDPFSIGEMLGLVPRGMIPELEEVDADLTVSLDTRINGVYYVESGRLPVIDLDFDVPSGRLYHKGSNLRFERIVLNGSARFDPDRRDSTMVVIRKMDVKMSFMSLKGNFKATNLLDDANIDATVKGNIDLKGVSDFLKMPQTFTGYGNVVLDLKARARMSDLSIERIGNTRIRGRIDADSIYVNMPEDTIMLAMSKGSFRFGAMENKRDTLIDMGTQMLRVSLSFERALFNYKDEIWGASGKSRISVRGAASNLTLDNSAIHPLRGSINTDEFRLWMPDSVRANLREMVCSFSMLPSRSNKKVPELKLDITSRSMFYRAPMMRASLNNNEMSFSATLASASRNRSTGAVRRERRFDSLHTLYPNVTRDSLNAHVRRLRAQSGEKDDLDQGDIDFTVDKSIGDLLRQWNVRGSIRSKNARYTTPYYPQRNRFRDLDIDFTMDRVDINNITITSGSSEMSVNGSISGIRRVLLGRGRLALKLDVNSPSLDVTQIIQTINAGVQFSEQEDLRSGALLALDDNQMQALIDERMEQMEESDLIIVPKNVEMDIHLNVGRGSYGNMVMNSLTVDLVSLNRSMQITDLCAQTDIGDVELTGLYTTRSKKDISAGFDLELKNVAVEKMIEMVPAIDSLLPMMRSFEGLINCQMAATVAIDSTMNLILPSLDAVCRIKGDNMVLLDGETFAELSKMLRFKNRKRNVIDHISVEMLIRNSQVEVFPFIMEMDRYRVAIDGVHKMDMSFKYHIAVLNSPIPFRFGVTLYGPDLDNVKFRIGKARYKDANLPSYTLVIDNTRVNLRDEINKLLFLDSENTDIRRIGITEALESVKVDVPEEELTREERKLLKAEGIIGVDEEGIDEVGEKTDEAVVKERNRNAGRRRQPAEGVQGVTD